MPWDGTITFCCRGLCVCRCVSRGRHIVFKLNDPTQKEKEKEKKMICNEKQTFDAMSRVLLSVPSSTGSCPLPARTHLSVGYFILCLIFWKMELKKNNRHFSRGGKVKIKTTMASSHFHWQEETHTEDTHAGI